MRYVFRPPRFPVILVVGDRAFRVVSTGQLRKLLRRELKSAAGAARLLDSTWEWFTVLPDAVLIAPSFLDRQPPTKQALIALVNGRSNGAPDAPVYKVRSLSNRTREEVFAELLAILPAG